MKYFKLLKKVGVLMNDFIGMLALKIRALGQRSILGHASVFFFFAEGQIHQNHQKRKVQQK